MKALMAVIAVLVLGGAAYYFTTTKTPDSTNNPPGSSGVVVDNPVVEPIPAPAGGEMGVPAGKQVEPDPAPGDRAAMQSTGTTSTTTTTTTTTTSAKIVTVSYQNNSFVPAAVEINVGDTVTFVNNHTATIWIASNPHPTHTSYPALDSGILQPRESYSIAFSQAVTVNYHNHNNPTATGTIIVR